MKKGFTLIELLAVIVILAIIALIVTPVISNVISGAKKSAAKQSTTSYVKAIDSTNQAKMLLENNISFKSTKTGVDINDLDVEVNGKKPQAGFVDIVNSRIIRAVFCIDNYQTEYLNGHVELEEVEDCKKVVEYVTYDLSDNENKKAELVASELPSSWKNYLIVTKYGNFISEISLCNKLNNKATCVSSSDVITKANIVKEENNGILVSNMCYDLSAEWRAEEGLSRDGTVTEAFNCFDNENKFIILTYGSGINNLVKATDRVYLGELGEIKYDGSCDFTKATGLDASLEPFAKYINMSKTEFLKLDFDDYKYIMAYLLKSNLLKSSQVLNQDIDTSSMTIEQLDALLESYRPLSSEEVLRTAFELVYAKLKEFRYLSLGGSMLYYDCYHETT